MIVPCQSSQRVREPWKVKAGGEKGAGLRQGLALDFPESRGLKVSPGGGNEAGESLLWGGSWDW